jgi:tungstate transport system ATP-binding protein
MRQIAVATHWPIIADIGHRDSAKVAAPSVLPLTVSAICFFAGNRHLLDHVSFTLEANSLTVILGPNGAGKSLLLRLCHGLLHPTSGTIQWSNKAPSEARRWLAMVFQHPVLLRRSVAANIAYGLRIRGVGWRERKNRVAAALTHTDLSHLADQPARLLSGGEQQRLAIARAWALQPQVLFLDEPTSNLDPAATRAVEDLIQTIHRAGTTLVMTTHDLGQARRLAREVLFLHQGRLLEHTPASEFFIRPKTLEAAAFIEGKLLC